MQYLSSYAEQLLTHPDNKSLDELFPSRSFSPHLIELITEVLSIFRQVNQIDVHDFRPDSLSIISDDVVIARINKEVIKASLIKYRLKLDGLLKDIQTKLEVDVPDPEHNPILPGKMENFNYGFSPVENRNCLSRTIEEKLNFKWDDIFPLKHHLNSSVKYKENVIFHSLKAIEFHMNKSFNEDRYLHLLYVRLHTKILINAIIIKFNNIVHDKFDELNVYKLAFEM